MKLSEILGKLESTAAINILRDGGYYPTFSPKTVPEDLIDAHVVSILGGYDETSNPIVFVTAYSD